MAILLRKALLAIIYENTECIKKIHKNNLTENIFLVGGISEYDAKNNISKRAVIAIIIRRLDR